MTIRSFDEIVAQESDRALSPANESLDFEPEVTSSKSMLNCLFPGFLRPKTSRSRSKSKSREKGRKKEKSLHQRRASNDNVLLLKPRQTPDSAEDATIPMPGAPIPAPSGHIPTPASMEAAMGVGMLPLALPPSDSQIRFEARRKRRARFERIYAEDQADVEGLAGRMRLLWSEYASSVLERHFIQSPQSLVVALFSTLATEHAAKALPNPTSRSGRRTPTQSATLAQLVTILRNSDVPRELLVPPVPTRPTSHDSVTVPRLLTQDPAKSHALTSAQHLLTHHLAATCSQLFTKLQNMHCIPLLRSLLARPRDKVPAFLITCPPEVEDMAKAKLLGRESSRDSVQFDADDRPAQHHRTRSLASVGTAASWESLGTIETDSDADSAMGSSLELMVSLQSGIPLSILPDWFNDPRATPLDRLAALLRRELAASTSNVLESLMSAGLAHVRAQNLYDMVLRAVRLFAYMSHINPHLRWTWTEFQGGMFDDDSMEMVNVLPVSVSLHTPLKVLFSVSPGIVIDNPSEPRPQVLIPERVFAIPKTTASSRPCTPRLSSPSPKLRAPPTMTPSPLPPMPSPRGRPKDSPMKLGDLASAHADLQSRLWAGTPLPTPSPTRANFRQMTPPGYTSAKSPTDSHMLVPPTPMFATSICQSPFISSPHSTWGQMEPIVSPTLASATLRSRHSISESNIAGLIAPRAVRLSQLLPPSLDVTRPPAPLSGSLVSPNPSSSHNTSIFQSPQAALPRSIASPNGAAPLGMSPAMASLLAPIAPTASPSSSFGISPMNGPRDLPLGGNNAPPNNTTLASARLLEAALMAADVVRARTPSTSRANSVNGTPIVSPARAQPQLPLTPFPVLSQQQQPPQLLPFPADDGRPVGEQMRKWLSATESTLIGRQLSTLPRTNSVANVLQSSRIEVAQQEAKPKRKRKSATFLLKDDGSDAEQEHEYVEEDYGEEQGDDVSLPFRDQNAAQTASA